MKRFVLLQFLNLRHTVGLLGRGISPSQGRYLIQTQHKRRQTSMLSEGFEPTIPVFDQAKTFNTLGGVATVIGLHIPVFRNFKQNYDSNPSLKAEFSHY
jgi:hypothetical protein